MDLQRVAMTTFILLQAEWSVDRGCRFIEQLKATHVIVHRHDLENLYYLLTTQEALQLLANASNAPSLREVLDLHNQAATPAIESDTDAELAPDRCVVLEDGHLFGFYDASIPPEQGFLYRGQDDNLKSIKPDLALRSLVAELPEKIYLNEVFSLLVYLSTSLTPEAGVALSTALPLGTTVDILVQPKRGFALEGRGEGQLVVSDEEETLPFQFKLRGVALGTGHLRVLAFYRGQPLGELKLRVPVLEAPVDPAVQYLSHEQSLAPVSLHQPDLSLVILEHPQAGAFTFHLTAQDPALGLNLKPFGPVHLRVDPLQYFQDFFRDIENLPLSTPREKADATQRLAAKGTHLFTSLFPADLQVLLWSLRNRIQSVQVQSQEPWIPWELCKLCGQERGRVIEGPFLCEAFAMTRWIPGIPMKPSLTLNNMAVVVPAGSGLAFAPKERAHLLSLNNSNRQVSPVLARSLELREALASGEYDGWHFTGHGIFRGPDPNKSAIYLENQEILTPEDLSGVVCNLGVAKPLVFLNACQIGRGAMSLTDIGGWAMQFLHAGGFIGAYWSVYDKPAYDFARALYDRLLTGMPIGKAVQQARTAIKPIDDPTWLAYTVFADPLATVQAETSSHK